MLPYKNPSVSIRLSMLPYKNPSVSIRLSMPPYKKPSVSIRLSMLPYKKPLKLIFHMPDLSYQALGTFFPPYISAVLFGTLFKMHSCHPMRDNPRIRSGRSKLFPVNFVASIVTKYEPSRIENI